MKIFILIFVSLSLIVTSCNKNKGDAIFNIKDSIAHYYSLSENENINDKVKLEYINKAYEFSNKLKTDSTNLAILHQKIRTHFRLQEYDRATSFNRLLFKKSNEINSLYYKAKYHFINSYYNELILLQKDSAFYNTSKSIDYFILLKDSSNVGKRFLDLAHMKYEASDYFGSIEYCTEALRFLSKKNDLKYIASIHSLIAYNYEDLKMFNDALNNHKKAISLASLINDKFSYKNNLAIFYNKLNKYEKAVESLESIILDSIKLPLHKAIINDNLQYSKWLIDKEKNIESNLLQNLQIKKKENNISGLVDSYEYLANFSITKNPIKAIMYAQKLIENSKIIAYPKGELKALKIIMAIDSNDTKSRDRYIKLKDSITLSQLKTRNQYAKIKYDNAQSLEANKNLTQKNEREKLLKSLYASIAVIILGILLFYFYYSFQKKKQTNLTHEQEKLQTVYKTETEISKKIHDELANGIHQVMMQAQNETSSVSEKTIDRLDELYERTRDFSHQISEIDVNEGYLTELKGMLEDYQDQNTSIVVSGIEVPDWNNLAAIKKETVYRVLNELMVNMKKHSKADLVILKFEKEAKNVKITYNDNGLGIDNEQLKKGTGLKNMENRIRSIQGTFTFENKTDQGLHISFSFPI